MKYRLLRRPCRGCGDMFTPTGPSCRICLGCKENKYGFDNNDYLVLVNEKKSKHKSVYKRGGSGRARSNSLSFNYTPHECHKCNARFHYKATLINHIQKC